MRIHFFKDEKNEKAHKEFECKDKLLWITSMNNFKSVHSQSNFSLSAKYDVNPKKKFHFPCIVFILNISILFKLFHNHWWNKRRYFVIFIWYKYFYTMYNAFSKDNILSQINIIQVHFFIARIFAFVIYKIIFDIRFALCTLSLKV